MMDNANKTDIKTSFLNAKRALFNRLYSKLNDRQREAVFSVNGPLLILAGAGSGKTTVLVNRIAFMIKFGNAYFSDFVPEGITAEEIKRLEDAQSFTAEEIEEILREYICDPCPPWAIMAITFTNKAANEMRTRLGASVGDYASDIWAGTFHSTCVRLLRKYCERIGYKPGFTIYDSEDSKRLIINCMSELNIDEKAFPPRLVQNQISRIKDKLQTPEDFNLEAGNDFKQTQIANIYYLYQKKLHESNVFDFDDLIMQTVRLLREDGDARDYCQRRFKYICVDEYQDTNPAQFELVKLLSGKYRNLMVVGDDDQSIYKFRGATIENILSFDKTFPDAKVIKLEENYRSTGNILNAANSVIRNNFGRRGKELWTERGDGEKVVVHKLDNQNEEAKYIINKIMEMVIREKRKFSNFAVLYRMNSQSNSLEQIFSRSGIAYRIIGGTRFYERKEIKDIIAYLCVINNFSDNLRLRRIINEPKRKIGETTVASIETISSENGISMFEVMEQADKYPAVCKTAGRLKEFTELIKELRGISENEPLPSLIEKVIELTGYRRMLLNGGESEIERLQNVNELISNAVEYARDKENATLSGFLEEISLITDIDNYDENSEAVVLMTVHSAKGLEFPVVFLPGFEDGIFPGVQSIMYPEELEEERRLAYVAITRAKDRLFCTHVRERLLYGKTQYNQPSRFLKEIPEECIEPDDVKKPVNEQPQRTSRRRTVISKEFFQKSTIASSVGKTTGYDRFTSGDRVSHMTFGEGIVLSAKEMGADILYEIAFDSCGTKKLMATYAKLKRL